MTFFQPVDCLNRQHLPLFNASMSGVQRVVFRLVGSRIGGLEKQRHVCVLMASIVTMAPSRHNRSSNCGMALISSLFSETACCSSTRCWRRERRVCGGWHPVPARSSQHVRFQRSSCAACLVPGCADFDLEATHFVALKKLALLVGVLALAAAQYKQKNGNSITPPAIPGLAVVRESGQARFSAG